MRDIKKVVSVKDGKKWVESFEVLDELQVYKDLASDLIAKKLNACTYIKTISRVSNYDGTQQITVLYSNDCRSVYTVKN